MARLVTFLGSDRKNTGLYCIRPDHTPETLYQGIGQPAYWLVILGCTNPDEAKQTASAFIRSKLPNGSPLVGQMDALDSADKVTAMGIIKSLRPGSTKTSYLLNAVLAYARYQESGKPVRLRHVVFNLREFIKATGKTDEQALEEVYSFLHGQVSFETWKGEYE